MYKCLISDDEISQGSFGSNDNNAVSILTGTDYDSFENPEREITDETCTPLAEKEGKTLKTNF